MSVLTIECFNYKQHKNLKIDLNGRSALLMGDIKVGKSNIMKLILAHTGQADYPSNPLTDGENEGSTKTTHLAPDGKVYIIQRKFKRNAAGEVEIERLWVYPPAGQRSSFESMVETVFGEAFKNGFFDYIEYFYKNKSAVTRGAYFIKAIGGSEVEQNVSDITKWKRERGQIGTEKDQKKAIFSHVNYNQETFEADHAKYSEEKEAWQVRDEVDAYVKSNLKDVSNLQAELNRHNAVANDIGLVDEAMLDIDNDILEFEKKIAQLREIRTAHEFNRNKFTKQLVPAKKLTKLVKDIAAANLHNEKLKEASSVLYDEKLSEFIKFQSDKKEFFSGLEAYDEWEKLEAKWNDLDKKITDTTALNEEIFRSRIPLPELTIGEHDGKPIILYNGKDFSEENLSTGERLAITTAIQTALNPNGDNFIIVPEAQSLGSELPLVLNELDKHNVQYLVEMTYPDEEFKVEIIERKVDGAAE